MRNKHGFVAVNKPAGVPAQADKTGDQSIHETTEFYCRTKLHLLNRLDRPASGLMIMSKKERFTKHYTDLQSKGKVIKTYFAITSKADIEHEGELENFLEHNTKSNKAIIVNKGNDKSKVELEYRILEELDNYLFVCVKIKSGKFHQIRAQLANVGMHIKGDVKYGARRKNKDRSIHLHAYHYEVNDPITKKKLNLIADLPKDNLWNAVSDSIEVVKMTLTN